MNAGDHGFRFVSEERIHDGYAVTVAVETFIAPDGHEFTRDVVHHPGAVAVVPLHDDDTVTLVRQFRAPLRAELWEIPAGLRDVVDEPPEDTAMRELAEEVGLRADHLEHLVDFHCAAGHTDEKINVYVGTGLHAVDNDLQGPEESAMTVARLPLAEVRAMIADGRITDAKTVIGITLLPER